jgi:predicted nucleotidyltransferase
MLNTQALTAARLCQPPKWLPENIHYETQMGSVAYGVSSDTSDVDLYGFCIPPKETVFPHLSGEIPGFGNQTKRFDQFQQHHIANPSELGGKGRTYDVTIFSIVKFFQLCMENNPNMVDALFTPQTCVLSCTAVGTLVREHRKLFLHKGSYHKFKGYAYQQLHKMTIKNPEPGSKRAELIEKYGYDTKFAYHLVRLLDEAEQILEHGDLDLTRASEQMKAVRRGEVPEQEIRDLFTRKEKQLEELYQKSSLQHKPDEAKIKTLLLQCLEHHYGSLKDVVVAPDRALTQLRRIREICEEAGI